MADNFSVVLKGLYLDPDIPFALYMFDVALNFVFSIITITGNALIIAALRRIPLTQVHTVLKAFLFNLALADLSVGLFVQPLYISSVLTATFGYQNASRILGAAFYLANWCLPSLSISFLTAIAVDRFLALYLRVRYRYVVTLKKVVAALVALWIYTCAGTLLIIFNSTVYNIMANFSLAVCLALTTFCYLKIYLTLRRHNNCVRFPLQATNIWCQKELASRKNFNFMRYKRSVWNMLYVYGAFILCSLPLFCIMIVIHVSGLDRTTKMCRFFAATLIFINCSLNPLLYCWKIREIKRVVLGMLSNIFCK